MWARLNRAVIKGVALVRTSKIGAAMMSRTCRRAFALSARHSSGASMPDGMALSPIHLMAVGEPSASCLPLPFSSSERL
jgi:hypothetical protein